MRCLPMDARRAAGGRRDDPELSDIPRARSTGLAGTSRRDLRGLEAESDARRTRARRLYRQPMTHDDAVAFIVKGRGTHFDPDVIEAFVEVSDILRGLSAEG